jgi:hypothetical protein
MEIGARMRRATNTKRYAGRAEGCCGQEVEYDRRSTYQLKANAWIRPRTPFPKKALMPNAECD